MTSTLRSKVGKREKNLGDGPAWLEPYRKGFFDELEIQGYSAYTQRQYDLSVKAFCAEVARRKLKKEHLAAHIAEVGKHLLDSAPEYDRTHAKFRLERFIAHLAKAKLIEIPAPPAPKLTATDHLRAEYVAYLRQQRGLSEATIDNCARYFERFMEFRFGGKLFNLNKIEPNDVVGFMRQLTPGVDAFRSKTVPSHLRSFFKFLFWSGKTTRNLANSIPRVAQPQASNLPRYLRPDEVKRLVDAGRTDNEQGRRDYAILLLLARLGLRAQEVIPIQLEDLDWRAGEILVRGKGKRHERMPLPAEVGAAIVDYIQHERPSCGSRALFVSSRPPHLGFKDGQIINCILQKALRQTGLQQPQKRVGSHLLRHSLATGMLAQGASLEEISHLLRHRSKVSTSIYAKCDVAALRTVAQDWPTEGGAQ